MFQGSVPVCLTNHARIGPFQSDSHSRRIYWKWRRIHPSLVLCSVILISLWNTYGSRSIPNICSPLLVMALTNRPDERAKHMAHRRGRPWSWDNDEYRHYRMNRHRYDASHREERARGIPPPPPPTSFPLPSNLQFLPNNRLNDPTRDKQESTVNNDTIETELQVGKYSSPHPRWNSSQDRRFKHINYNNLRNDALSKYTSSTLGTFKLSMASACVGFLLGAFIEKSIRTHATSLAPAMATLFVGSSLLRNEYGDLTRTLGLALLCSLDIIHPVRERYTTSPHWKGLLRLGPRRPFPPLTGTDMEDKDNPWTYRPVQNNDPEFHMVQSIVAITLLGSVCGSSVPLLSNWMGSLAGAAGFAWFGTARTSTGDLVRTIGMRVVSLVEEVWGIQSQLHVAPKVGNVANLLLDHILVLDRKHQIKHRIWKGVTWASMAMTRVKDKLSGPR